MREILFRGKRIDNDEWVYGSFCMDAVEQKNGLCGVDGFIRLYDFDKGKMQMHEVDRETVGQFTGLTDKNGVKIFEGDVLDWDEREWGSKFREVAEWSYSLLSARKHDWHEWCKVVGNIHDNPELLEEVK